MPVGKVPVLVKTMFGSGTPNESDRFRSTTLTIVKSAPAVVPPNCEMFALTATPPGADSDEVVPRLTRYSKPLFSYTPTREMA